jgi:hypothetical protein
VCAGKIEITLQAMDDDDRAMKNVGTVEKEPIHQQT